MIAPSTLRTTACLIAAGFALALSPTSAQDSQPQPVDQADSNDYEESSHPGFWQGRFAGGHYMVRLGSIASLSKHEYIVDAAIRVIEVNIATNSSVNARSHYLEPVTSNSPLAAGQAALDRLESVVREGAARTGTEGQLNEVAKNYPISTHAHTVEFRVRDAGSLDSLYRSVQRGLLSGRGRTWNDPARQ